ncbi:hypothetical protein KFL_000830350 [Klebsormidium nitens]|uniref:B30.2/SPRY domain-containing protein n=1 Tax=Klebsormidium nitens TaxID=105231 RepID=A0A1Y1HTU7_KLENI|nr:hypothetical protein KFL_000830350 [Klebsormidium nitens]|eukprot:GAQ81553.1 hypothetical protein KFL_000830350 [Klebsormidium nitens]
MEPSEGALPEPASIAAIEAPTDPPEGLIGAKRKSSEADTVILAQDAQEQLALPPSLEPPAKKSKKKSGGKGKSGKKGSKKGNGRPALVGLPGEQVEQRALIPASRDSLEVLTEVLLSRTERAPQIQLSADQLTASSTKGYRMVRATTGPYDGAWYFEIKIVHLGETGHTRLGWSMSGGDLQAPVGYDTHSYGYRDVDGSKVHNTWREEYGAGYGEGDVVGCYINLPGGVRPEKADLVDYRGKPHHTETAEVPQQPLKDSQVAFFKNGECQGVAYWSIFGGQYFPAASLYTSNKQSRACEIRFNFGPDWDCPPSDWKGLPVPQPVSKLAAVALQEAKSAQNGGANGANVRKELAVERGTNGAVTGPAGGIVNGTAAGTSSVVDTEAPGATQSGAVEEQTAGSQAATVEPGVGNEASLGIAVVAQT